MMGVGGAHAGIRTYSHRLGFYSSVDSEEQLQIYDGNIGG